MTIPTTFDFDQIINRRGTNCAKHDFFDADVLPMWVADMDFASPQPVIDALKERADHGVFGYTFENPVLSELIVARMDALYGWKIRQEDIVFLPGVVSGFNVAIRAFGSPGDNVLMQTPVYPPFLMAPAGHGQTPQIAELTATKDGNRLHYEIDFDAFEAAITPETKVFLLCSPHNPVGRVWTRDELQRMAEICLKHDVLICSDEIHCDLLFDGVQHIPTASLSPEVAARTITLMAPSKTFNLPGLACAFAIIQDADLRKRFTAATAGIVGHVGIMGFTGALAAYRDGGPWLDAALEYMQANRDYTTAFFDEFLPDIAITSPQGTYLSWLDTRACQIESDTDAGMFSSWIDPYFLKHARVALNAGAVFGQGGAGFTRLNFACPRPILTEALERMRAAVNDPA